MEKEIEKIKVIYADCNLTDEEALEIYKAMSLNYKLTPLIGGYFF